MDKNYIGWANHLAPAIMQNAGQNSKPIAKLM
ncbi:hypothetical protein BH09GEM1_BH09GEM1_10150 [soil metagenome]